jgi:hypothetical protein
VVFAAQAQPLGAWRPLPPIAMQTQPADSLLGREVAGIAEAALRAYAPGERPRMAAPILIIIAADREDFQRLAQGNSPEWAAGLIIEPGRTILLMKAPLADRVEAGNLLRHEIAHIMLDRMLGGRTVPHWFHEGFAQQKAGEWDMEELWSLSRAAWTRTAIPLSELRQGFPYSGPRARLAYAQSQAAVQALSKDGASWAHLLALLEDGRPFSEALRLAAGYSESEFEALFDGKMMPGYRRLSLLASTAPLFGLMAVIFLVGSWRRYRRRRNALADSAEEGERPRLWIDRRHLR